MELPQKTRRGSPESTAKKSRPRKKRCRNCDVAFQPKRRWQEFHTEDCRKEFWRHGGISIRRLLPTVEKLLIEPRLRPLVERIAALEARLSGGKRTAA